MTKRRQHIINIIKKGQDSDLINKKSDILEHLKCIKCANCNPNDRSAKNSKDLLSSPSSFHVVDQSAKDQ